MRAVTSQVVLYHAFHFGRCTVRLGMIFGCHFVLIAAALYYLLPEFRLRSRIAVLRNTIRQIMQPEVFLVKEPGDVLSCVRRSGEIQMQPFTATVYIVCDKAKSRGNHWETRYRAMDMDPRRLSGNSKGRSTSGSQEGPSLLRWHVAQTAHYASTSRDL